VRGSATLLALVFLVAACATPPGLLNIPSDVVGLVSGPRYTGWMLDSCNEGQVTKSLTGCATLETFTYDIEIFRATVHDVQTPAGAKVSPKLVVGLVSHALRKDYRKRANLHLERAPEDFRVETGIEFLAWVVTPNTSFERTRGR
jgi:hypothetical protein